MKIDLLLVLVLVLLFYSNLPLTSKTAKFNAFRRQNAQNPGHSGGSAEENCLVVCCLNVIFMKFLINLLFPSPAGWFEFVCHTVPVL